MQKLAGIIVENESTTNPEKAIQSGLEDFLKDIQSATANAKPSPNDKQMDEELLTLAALTAGAPGLIQLLGKGANLISQYASNGYIESNSIGRWLIKAGHNLEHKYIAAISALLLKFFPSKFKGQDPFDEKSQLHDYAHAIYAVILGGAAIISAHGAAHAISSIIKGLEGGASAFKTAEIVQLAQKIAKA